MKVLLSIVACALLGSPAIPAQSIDWQHIVDMRGPQKLAPKPLSATLRHNLEEAIVASNTVWDDCEDDHEWPHAIQAHRINVGAGHFTLAEAGAGCARGGQGANGAMWLLRWDGATPVVLGELDGWFDAVLPQTAGNLHDVAVGWHSSANEYGLALYRFNGKKYRLVDGTTVHCDIDNDEHCVAVAGKPALGRAESR